MTLIALCTHEALDFKAHSTPPCTSGRYIGRTCPSFMKPFEIKCRIIGTASFRVDISHPTTCLDSFNTSQAMLYYFPTETNPEKQQTDLHPQNAHNGNSGRPTEILNGTVMFLWQHSHLSSAGLHMNIFSARLRHERGP